MDDRTEYIDNIEEAVTVLVLCPANGNNPGDANCTWGQPGILWGAPGIGKSKRVEFVGKDLALTTEALIPSTHAPESVSGALVPDGKGGARIVSMLGGVRRLIEDKQGILFLDELSCAKPAVQAAFLNVVLERKVGEERLPGGVRIIAAANPPNEAAGGWDLEAPMANRFVHLYIRPPSWQAWNDWLENDAPPRFVGTEASEDLIREQWPLQWAKTRSLFAGFNRHTGGKHLHSIPEEDHDDRGRAWPSHRTWEMAARLHATCHILNKQNLILALVSGCVGMGAAIELNTWFTEADLPDPKDVIDGKWVPNIKRLDRVVMAYSAATTFVLQEKDEQARHDMAVSFWSALGVGISKGAADIVNNMASRLVNRELGRHASSQMMAAATPVLVDLAKKGFGDYV